MKREATTEARRSTEMQYRIDFALMTIAGNISRLRTTRPLVEHDPEVVSRWYPIDTWRPNDWVHVFPGMAKVWARHLLDSRRVLFGSAPDALVVHAFETYGLFALRKKLFRTPTVLVYNPDNAINSRFNQLAYSQTDLFVPWSNDCRDRLAARSKDLASHDVRVLHPGIDLDEWTFTPFAERPEGRRFRLLFIGGDFRRKGGATLLDAFESSLGQSCDLTCVTQEAYTSRDELSRMKRHPHIDLRLDVAPGSGAAQEFYAAADALLLPTESEGLPWVLLEALASGTPVISTLVNGIPDVVEDGVTGLSVDVGSASSIVEAVGRLQTDPELARRLIENGRRHVEAHFDAQRNTETLLTWIKELIDERRRAPGDR